MVFCSLYLMHVLVCLQFPFSSHLWLWKSSRGKNVGRRSSFGIELKYPKAKKCKKVIVSWKPRHTTLHKPLWLLKLTQDPFPFYIVSPLIPLWGERNNLFAIKPNEGTHPHLPKCNGNIWSSTTPRNLILSLRSGRNLALADCLITTV